MGKVIDFNSKREAAKHQNKEQRADAMKDRFEKALPSEETSPKKKLLGIFKRKNSQKKQSKPAGDGWES